MFENMLTRCPVLYYALLCCIPPQEKTEQNSTLSIVRQDHTFLYFSTFLTPRPNFELRLTQLSLPKRSSAKSSSLHRKWHGDVELMKITHMTYVKPRETSSSAVKLCSCRMSVNKELLHAFTSFTSL